MALDFCGPESRNLMLQIYARLCLRPIISSVHARRLREAGAAWQPQLRAELEGGELKIRCSRGVCWRAGDLATWKLWTKFLAQCCEDKLRVLSPF